MKIIRNTILTALIALAISSCSKKEDLTGVTLLPALGTPTWTQDSLDLWINQNFTVPYNIAAVYKWDQFNFDLTKTLVPPKEEKIEPALSAIKKVWIDAYVAEGGATFFKQICPKFLILSGSVEWNPDGTHTLGTAEGGVQIMILNLNSFLTKGMAGYKKSDSTNLKFMCHVIEHEFGHILHQHVLYPAAYKAISAGGYSSNWVNISDADANADGFVTAYSSSNFDDDFVEMIAIMLTEGRAGFDRIVNSIPAGTSVNGTTQAQAIAKLRLKESIVVTYFKSAWNIDFYNLQTRVRTSIEQMIY